MISLDFELHWGVRDKKPVGHPYTRNLWGAREAIPRVIDLFIEHGIAATWATVGFLFARDRATLDAFRPARLPTYADESLNPYSEPIGVDEHDDPLHFAPTLVSRIAQAPLQEVGSHTFSHYYCAAEGQTIEQFRDDLDSAQRIAQTAGLNLTSLVFPRNQHNPAYDSAVVDAGFTCYRGNPTSRLYAASGNQSPARRTLRLLDSFAGRTRTHEWPVATESGLLNIPASYFLRPWKPRSLVPAAQARRIGRELETAANYGRILHLWWHPHNFGVNLEENMRVLRGLLGVFDRCRKDFGMTSLSMRDCSELVLADR